MSIKFVRKVQPQNGAETEDARDSEEARDEAHRSAHGGTAVEPAVEYYRRDNADIKNI
jgi:hypothetical protein